MEHIAKITIQVEGETVSTKFEGKPTISELVMAINSLISHTTISKNIPRKFLMSLIKFTHEHLEERITEIQVDDRSEE